MNLRVAIVLALVAVIAADMYMQNPRGSNDRCNEANTNRNNANRLFDSQNNAKGGYCKATKMKYYVGSILPIEWTNQHGCGANPNVKCDVVIQYMCADSHDDIRDGTTTQTIPENEDDDGAEQMVENPDFDNGEEDFDVHDPERQGQDVYLYGKHESYDYYQECRNRERNKGLFIADRNVGGAARNTRQNNNGNRHGFECPEERDYYPYWHPSPWKDIAILTDHTELCDFFTSESFNVADRHLCSEQTFNNQDACESNGGEWQTIDSHGIDAPECREAPRSRDNHLGNGEGMFNNVYNWTIPDDPNNYCVLRLRYNISTTDYDGWNTDSSSNAEASPVKQDPYVEVEGQNLSLAIDTSQFARTFQDRSHVFAIESRSRDVLTTSRIYNFNVRGKRGNIVQTYPATEYDFVPTFLEVRAGDYIHFQWTGCDTNPANNDGEGTQQTDRSNLVQLKKTAGNYPEDSGDFFSGDDASFMAHLGQHGNDNPEGECLSQQELLDQNNNNQDNADRDTQNCMKLNNAPRYFNFGLFRVWRGEGESYHFMSSRNNNFTNRSQKTSITVIPFLPVWAIVLVVLGAVLCISASGVTTVAVVARALPNTKLGSVWGMIS